MCGSLDLFVLENGLKQFSRVISLISRPHQVNLKGVNMFKRHIHEFSKKSQNWRFLKMHKNSTSRENLMFFRAVTTPLMTPVPNFNKWCAVANFLFKNIDFCIFTPKTLLVKDNYFLTLWNFTYLKDTSFGKKSCNFEHGLETKK